MSTEVLLLRLEKVKRTGAENWIACCPAHEDRQPSMTVRETGDGLILVHCFAGCGIDSILSAVGMEVEELYPDRPVQHSKPLRHKFSARDVLECVANEALIVALVAAGIAESRPVPPADLDRCRLANIRIHEAIDAIA
jgi:CHC2 zinc finger